MGCQLSSESANQGVIKKPDDTYKLIIVGPASVGKSCILLQFIENRFTSVHDITIGVEFSMKNLIVNGKTVKIQAWDTVLLFSLPLYLGWTRKVQKCDYFVFPWFVWCVIGLWYY